MLKKTIFIPLILISFLFFSCSKDKPEEINPSEEKEIISFSFKKDLNPGLTRSISGKIENSKILLDIPSTVDRENLIASFEYLGEEVYVNSVPQISGETPNDFTGDITYVVEAEDGSKKNYKVDLNLIQAIPHIYIDIENGEWVVEKKTYLNADITIKGYGQYEDYEGTTKIRGRGNSTWEYFPKKPFRIKLNEATSLMGLPAYKNWILLAEYIDGSMLYNSVPFKAGQLLDIPYTNTMIPVDLTMNGEYQGMYVFSEHKEVGPGRIDIGDEGVLLELDTYFDEDYKFISDKYELPVMIQHPELEDFPGEEAQQKLAEIQSDFEEMEALVFDESFPNNNYLNYFDDLSFVNYMLVYELTMNPEINYPKSTYINKLVNGKYRMGIIWDFDWGYGYGITERHYDISTANQHIFWGEGDEGLGTVFFQRFYKDPHIVNLLAERWNWFKANKYEELIDYVKYYGGQVKQAYKPDHELWGSRGSANNIDQDLKNLLDWLDARKSYMDSRIAQLQTQSNSHP